MRQFNQQECEAIHEGLKYAIKVTKNTLNIGGFPENKKSSAMLWLSTMQQVIEKIENKGNQ